MSEAAYKDPKLALNRIYTKRGDAGETSLVNGRRVRKDDLKIDAFGTVDELNAFVGQARLSAVEAGLAPLAEILLRVQHELFNLGSALATDPAEVRPQQPQIGEADIRQLESEIDEANADLEMLRSFVLAGGCRLNTDLHVCRTVCRRAERVLVALSAQEEVSAEAIGYVNRLSDAFFVWSRWACGRLGVEETLWEPNRASSAR